MELIAEAERLGEVAQDLQKQGHWLQAKDKHQSVAQLLDQILNDVTDQDAAQTLQLLAAYHRKLGAYITQYLENKKLESRNTNILFLLLIRGPSIALNAGFVFEAKRKS